MNPSSTNQTPPIMLRKPLVFSTLWALFLFCACQSNTAPAETAAQESPGTTLDKTSGQAFVKDDVSSPNILQVALDSEDHSTLVAAVQAADLENALVNAGPLTVFAPVNTAFDQLPEGTLDELLKPENKADLAHILKYHVTAATYTEALLRKFEALGQANGQDVAVEKKGEDIYVGGAKILASVRASNGIIHVVDAVMLPPNQ